MFRNYFLINLLLVSIIALLGVGFYKVWSEPLDIPVKTGQGHYEKIGITAKEEEQPLIEDSYEVISNKNLFHPSRSSAKKRLKVSKPVSKNEFPQLFGTVISNETRFAILEDLSTKKTALYKVNDLVDGFVVSEILEEKVILQKGGESIGLNLRADKKFKPPERIQNRPVTVRKLPKQRKRPRRRRPPVMPRRRR